ncbi:MAG: S41 family peptidase, partial [Pseudomonadota bacterium]
LGGDVAENLVFTSTEFNADRAPDNNVSAFFNRLGNSINLSRLVIIATPRTASASELVINGMEPHVDVTIVGDRTFGKPIGQLGFEFCEQILRITGFQTVNADGDGDYFNGLPADCPAPDDISIPVGDDADPNIIAAMSYLDNNACPVTLNAFEPTTFEKVAPDLSGPPWREYLDAY